MVRREILRLGIFAKTVVSFCFRLLPSMKHTDSIIFFLDNAKKLIQNRPTPPPPPWGGGGGEQIPCQPLRSNLRANLQVQAQIKKIKKLTCNVPCGTIPTMTNINWIPRSQRWTDAERQARKIQAQNAREIRWMFWRESQTFREQIEKEISEKLLAKRAAIE